MVSDVVVGTYTTRLTLSRQWFGTCLSHDLFNAPVNTRSRRGIFSATTTAAARCRQLVPRGAAENARMPFSGQTMNILIRERAPFQPETELGYGTNILPIQMSRRARDDEGASDKCGRRRRERERARRERENRKQRPHIVRHEVPTDIHRHVYRKCNYSLKGSSILSDPSRSKWVLH